MTDEKRAEIERLATEYTEKKLIVERMGYQAMPNDPEVRKQISVSYELAVAELNEAEGLLREAQKYLQLQDNKKECCFTCRFGCFSPKIEDNKIIEWSHNGQCVRHAPVREYKIAGYNEGFPEMWQELCCGDWQQGPERALPTIKKDMIKND